MNPPNPYQHIQDANHIRLLAIFHCVYGGLCTLAGLGFLGGTIAMLIFVAPKMSAAMSAGAWATTSASTYGTSATATSISPGVSSYSTTAGTHASSTAAASVGAMTDMMDLMLNLYALIYGGLGLVLIVIGILCFVSARKMATRRSQTFSMIVAGFNCLGFPLGTTLGVFTFVVLLRPSVAAEYERASTDPKGGAGATPS